MAFYQVWGGGGFRYYMVEWAIILIDRMLELPPEPCPEHRRYRRGRPARHLSILSACNFSYFLVIVVVQDRL